MQELELLKKQYIHNILSNSLSTRDYSTVIFSATFPLDEVKDIIEGYREEFNLKNIIFLDIDYEKVKEFYLTRPKEEEIKKFIPMFDKPIGNTKMIYFGSTTTDYCENAYCGETIRYEKALRKNNKELYEIIKKLPTTDQTVTILPNKAWAQSLLGSEEKLNDLWLIISQALLDEKVTKIEADKRIERKNELNKMKIHKLHFYTDLGTDFKIALNKHSIWACEPENHNGLLNYFNYPSYEIFTSPNCFSAEGRIVLAKGRKFYYDIFLEKVTFDFKRGRLIDCNSNNKYFEEVILNRNNKMNRIGEIALVPKDSPLTRLNQFYDSEELDENTGCHFALGRSIDCCIGVDKEKVEARGMRYYGYNDSKYHLDLVFGNNSTTVEAELYGKKKVLIMENGLWKI